MMSENFVLLIGRIVQKPTLTGSDKDQISRTKIRVRNGGNSNVIPVISFGKNAEILHSLGDRGMEICAKCRIEMRQREIDPNTKLPFISVVIDSFNVYGTPSPATYNDQANMTDQDASDQTVSVEA